MLNFKKLSSNTFKPACLAGQHAGDYYVSNSYFIAKIHPTAQEQTLNAFIDHINKRRTKNPITARTLDSDSIRTLLTNNITDDLFTPSRQVRAVFGEHEAIIYACNKRHYCYSASLVEIFTGQGFDNIHIQKKNNGAMLFFNSNGGFVGLILPLRNEIIGIEYLNQLLPIDNEGNKIMNEIQANKGLNDVVGLVIPNIYDTTDYRTLCTIGLPRNDGTYKIYKRTPYGLERITGVYLTREEILQAHCESVWLEAHNEKYDRKQAAIKAERETREAAAQAKFDASYLGQYLKTLKPMQAGKQRQPLEKCFHYNAVKAGTSKVMEEWELIAELTQAGEIAKTSIESKCDYNGCAEYKRANSSWNPYNPCVTCTKKDKELYSIGGFKISKTGYKFALWLSELLGVAEEQEEEFADDKGLFSFGGFQAV